MLLTTPEELRMYLPTHAMDNLDSLAGFIDNSEQDFLIEKIGRPLYAAVCTQYEALADKLELLPQSDTEKTVWMKLITLCQRPIAFDAMYRSADMAGVSVNASGINTVSTDGYDASDKDSIGRYKTRCNIESHRAIDRLLVQLEEWAEELVPIQEAEDSAQEGEVLDEKAEIVALWKKSRYYYLANGLFINTATKFNEFVDIYDSREKFIGLLPDLRYCQEIILRAELGDDLIDDLITKMQSGELSDVEGKAVEKLQRTLAMAVEARNKLFTRKEAKDDFIQNRRMALAYISDHQNEFLPAIEHSPLYKKEKQPEVNVVGGSGQSEAVATVPFRNNQKGNAIFMSECIE